MKDQTQIQNASYLKRLFIGILVCLSFSCNVNKTQVGNSIIKPVTAKDILGNPNYQAICYGGYRTNSRDIPTTTAQMKEDMLILAAMNIKIIRTYNVHFEETKNLLQVIADMKKENSSFEMYVMLGAWIDCKNAWTTVPMIRNEDSDRNVVEIAECVRLANKYPDIIKVISVGNEAMVHWASSYHVTPGVILKWVNHLQKLKQESKLPKDIWITSSDNYAAWGGGDAAYHVADLKLLYQAVDYVSIHTYPMHETHYHPYFWGIMQHESELTDKEKLDAVMLRARDYAKNQYRSVEKYMKSLGVNKPIHIGETGWAINDNNLYGNVGTKATDEYKSALIYKLMREWTNKENISCFYFEAFDEIWKDKDNATGSENHFGLFTLDGQAKYALWDLYDKGVFNNCKRDGKKVAKTYNGNEAELLKSVQLPGMLRNKE